MATQSRQVGSILTGAAFLMAVSAIGPGFLTQTTRFTAQLGPSLAFAILLSVLVDIGAQLNTWRVIGISRRRGNEVASAVVPGLGWVVLAVIFVGSFIFNIGNLSGCALGLEALCGLPQPAGASLSGLAAAGLFLLPAMLKGVDWFSKLLGVGMILMTLYVVFQTAPDIGAAARGAVRPEHIEPRIIVTLVGGTIGGYIMFSGAHRLIDGGIGGPEQAGLISWAAVQGILIAGLMRVVVFLAVLGVVQVGTTLSNERPVFDAFQSGAGQVGYVLSCLVFWAAAITSVVGCAYTSISFVRPDPDDPARPRLLVGFVAASLAATLLCQWAGWEPTPLLIAAGTVNGVLLPVILGAVLIAAHRPEVMGEYQHPWWATAAGMLAWLGTLYLAYGTVVDVTGWLR